jgi:RNA polymerase sigma-70 factor (ECF subfamily)
MDGNHPKRRKDKYNPYSIYRNENGDCFLSFKDGKALSITSR